jgi:hypothetical protein
MFAVLHYFRLAFESPHLFRASQPLQVGCELKRLVPGCRDLCSSSTAKQGDHEKQQIEEYIANAMAEVRSLARNARSRRKGGIVPLTAVSPSLFTNLPRSLDDSASDCLSSG